MRYMCHRMSTCVLTHDDTCHWANSGYCQDGGPNQSSSSELTCEMEAGDGSGGTEARIGDAASPQQCAQMVRRMRPEVPRASGKKEAPYTMVRTFGSTD